MTNTWREVERETKRKHELLVDFLKHSRIRNFTIRTKYDNTPPQIWVAVFQPGKKEMKVMGFPEMVRALTYYELGEIGFAVGRAADILKLPFCRVTERNRHFMIYRIGVAYPKPGFAGELISSS